MTTKRKITLAVAILLILSAFGIYLFAQTSTVTVNTTTGVSQPPVGTFNMTQTGTTTSAPAKITFANQASGTASRIDLSGNGADTITTANADGLTIGSYYGIHIYGATNSTTPPTMVAGSTNDPGLTVHMGTNNAANLYLPIPGNGNSNRGVMIKRFTDTTPNSNAYAIEVQRADATTLAYLDVLGNWISPTFRAGNGSAAAPGLSFSGANSTGLWNNGGSLNFSSLGTNQFYSAGGRVAMVQAAGVSGGGGSNGPWIGIDNTSCCGGIYMTYDPSSNVGVSFVNNGSSGWTSSNYIPVNAGYPGGGAGVFIALTLHHSTGGAGTGLGTAVAYYGDSATVADRLMGQHDIRWSNGTDASRTAEYHLLLENNAGASPTDRFSVLGGGGFVLNNAAAASGKFPQSDGTSYKDSSFKLPTTGGTSGQVITSNGTDAIWQNASGGGNVSNSGTPTSGQYARWVTATSIEGVSTSTVKTDLSLNNVTNDAQVKKASSSTNGAIPTWNGTTGDALNTGGLTAPTGTIVGDTDTQTLTNKEVTPRVVAQASSATWSPNADTTDVFTITTAQATNVTTISSPSGTAVDGQKLIFRIKCDGTARTLAGWNAIYRFSSDMAAPTTLVANKTFYLGFIYNSTDSKWDNVSQMNNF